MIVGEVLPATLDSDHILLNHSWSGQLIKAGCLRESKKTVEFVSVDLATCPTRTNLSISPQISDASTSTFSYRRTLCAKSYKISISFSIRVHFLVLHLHGFPLIQQAYHR